jgi:hypothetical protein
MMPQADSLTCPIRPEETELTVLRMLTTRDNSRSQPRRVGDLNRRQPQMAANSARGAASFAAGMVMVGWLGLLLRGPLGGRWFSVTVKMDLKIAAVITAIGLGVSGGLAVAGVGAVAGFGL